MQIQKHLLTFSLISMACFSLWPLFVRKSGFSDGWAILFIGIGFFVLGVIKLTQNAEYPVGLGSGALFLFMAVVLCVLGNGSFTKITTDISPDAFNYIVLVMAGVPVITKIIDLVVTNTTPKWENIVGIIGICICIYLTTKK